MIQDPLNWQLYDNTLRQWLLAVALGAGTFVALLTLRWISARRFIASAQRPPSVRTNADRLSADLVRRTRIWFLIILGIAVARLPLTFPPRTDRVLNALTIVALLLQVALWANGLISHAIAFYADRRSTPSGESGPTTPTGPSGPTATTMAALSILVRVVVWSMLILIALDNLGIHITTLIAGLGITGIAVALALQNILGDLFAALAIVMDKPFVVGDAIAVDTLGGTVERIGLKTTRVRAGGGEELIFSNADLLKSRIHNMQRLRERTVTLSLMLDASAAVERLAHAPALAQEVIAQQANVRFGRAHVTTLSKCDVGFEVIYVVLTRDYGVFMEVQQAITLGLLDRFRREGLRFV